MLTNKATCARKKYECDILQIYKAYQLYHITLLIAWDVFVIGSKIYVYSIIKMLFIQLSKVVLGWIMLKVIICTMLLTLSNTFGRLLTSAHKESRMSPGNIFTASNHRSQKDEKIS